MATFEIPDTEPGDPLPAEWWAPINALAAHIAGDHRYRLLDPHDFVVDGRVRRSSSPTVVHYRHRYTRREVVVDAAGAVYRWYPPKAPTGTSRYRVQADPHEQIWRLDLWSLPWLKPGLEREQRTLDWDDRWMIVPRPPHWTNALDDFIQHDVLRRRPLDLEREEEEGDDRDCGDDWIDGGRRPRYLRGTARYDHIPRDDAPSRGQRSPSNGAEGSDDGHLHLV